MHLSIGDILYRKGMIYQGLKHGWAWQRDTFRPRKIRNVLAHVPTNVKCFARKTPQKQGFKTCKIEKINRLAGCKTGDWQGGKNVFLSKNIALAALDASFWQAICMPLTHKGIQIDVLKQCFSSKIHIKRIFKLAENSQITEYKIVTNMSHAWRICNDLHRRLQISQGAKAMLSRKFNITFRLSYPRGQSLLSWHEQARQ